MLVQEVTDLRGNAQAAIDEAKHILQQESPKADELARVQDLMELEPKVIRDMLESTANKKVKDHFSTCVNDTTDVACNPDCSFRHDLQCPYDQVVFGKRKSDSKDVLAHALVPEELKSRGSTIAYVYWDKELTAEQKDLLKEHGYNSYRQFTNKDGSWKEIKPVTSLNPDSSSITITLLILVLIMCISAGVYYYHYGIH